MELVKISAANDVSKVFIHDFHPNQAMANEFQTSFLFVRLHQMEYIQGALQEYEVEEGSAFLCFDVSIKNMSDEILGMYASDFSIRCKDEKPSFPEHYFSITNQFEDEFDLAPDELKQGKLIFVIKSGVNVVNLQYTDYIDEKIEGKTYRLKYQI